MTSELFDMVALAQRAAEVAEGYDPEFQGFINHLALTGGMCNQTPDDWYYRNYYDVVLREGSGPRIQALELPDYYEVMEKQQCFYNAWCLCMETPGLTYVEGFAQCRFIPVEHAWIEEADGTIIDPTWAGIAEPGEEAVYFGVRFTTEFIMKLSMETGWSSVFQGDTYNDNKILQRGLKMHNGIAVDLNEVGT
jgi:hypothetical protein